MVLGGFEAVFSTLVLGLACDIEDVDSFDLS